jgi:two-component system chemotaxis sensor kinase CheA
MTSSIDIGQFLDVFFEESGELLAEMEGLLLAIDISSPDKEECNAIFRTAHSIKGGAATFGLTDMVELTHIMESLLDKIRKGSMKLTEDHVSAFLKAKDILKRQLYAHHQKLPVESNISTEVLGLLRDLSKQSTVDLDATDVSDHSQAIAKSTDEPLSSEEVRSFFRIELPQISKDDLEALTAELALKGDLKLEKLPDARTVLLLETSSTFDDLVAICSFLMDPKDVHITEVSALSNVVETMGCIPADDVCGNAVTSDEYGLFEPLNRDKTAGDMPFPAKDIDNSIFLASAHAFPKKEAADTNCEKSRSGEVIVFNQDSRYIRVNLEKVDQLINLVGELVITQAMIDQHAGRIDAINHEQLLNHLTTLARNTRDLQESVMSIRMMPMELVFSRFPRMVRELAGKLGKKAKLITIGGATELDKGLIERIIDPLTHLVRNGIDHGLEEPHVRLQNHKPETGIITLSAVHESGNIVLQVHDDGCGLDRETIVRKAMDCGISVSDEMSDEEVWQIIFAPGFTTAKAVTDVSGRGVGMDVVKRNIAAMGGSVDIHSIHGQGTYVTITLPLTLAILEGMLIRSGEEVYILPLLVVVESLQPVSGQIREISGKGMVIRVREEYIPLIFLHELFAIPSRLAEPTEGIVVVVEALGKKAALLVDSLIGQQQIVVKNLETNFRRIPGVSGATILGDGSVSLILDVPSLLSISNQLYTKQTSSNLALS